MSQDSYQDSSQELSKDSSQDQDTTCLICFENYLESENRNWLIRTQNCQCQTIYHLKCFLNWYKEHRECPICHIAATDESWQVMIYHNNKWKMLPFNFIIDMVSDNDFFNTVIDITSSQNQEELQEKKCCKSRYPFLFYISIFYNIVLSLFLFL